MLRFARLFLFALVIPLACGGEEPSAAGDAAKPAAQAAAPSAAPAAATAPAQAPATPPPPRREPPLPGFEGVTLDGKPLTARDLLGRRALLFFFNPDVAEAGPAADAVARIAGESAANNFAIFGVALGKGGSRAREFATQHRLDFPIVDDASGGVAASLQLRAPVALIGADGDGYVVFVHGGISPGDVPDAAAAVETQLRESLRLPALAQTSLEPTLGTRSPAPAFSAERLEGGGRIDLASLRGKPVVLVFFLYTCPHCHHALAFMKTELAKIPEAARPALIGVSVSGSASAVQAQLKSDGLDFFPVVVDNDHALRTAYGVMGGVPDIFVIDAQGGVVVRVQGWRDDRDPALMRMWLAKLAGQPVPMLLHATGYSGSDACGVCHEAETTTWLLTQHASAFDTLVRHSAAAKPDCVGCHVVGFEKTGGYTISPPATHLEDVGCESCHGRGGPHLSARTSFARGTTSRCASAATTRSTRSASRTRSSCPGSRTPRTRGSQRCRSRRSRSCSPSAARRAGRCCQQRPPTSARRPAAPATRRSSRPGRSSRTPTSLASLEKKGATQKLDCLSCHTTAMGRPGGFPKDGKPADHADLARVGCESCHGPGGDHVKPDAPRVGTIVSLTDKCGSCVILQICGTCHDDENDPGFEFEVEKKIEAQKHGTIEPSATRGAEPSAARDVPSASWVGSLERGFALTGERE